MKIQLLTLLFLLLLENILSSSHCSTNENYCLKCNPITNICFKCKYDILIPDNNGGCVGFEKCILGNNYCEKCNENGNLCQICEDDYYPDENGGCSFTNHCHLSDKGECFECQKNYFLVQRTKICKSLLSSDLRHCLTINETDGYCEECEEGYYLDEGDKKCSKTENCFISSFGICSSCKKGYYLEKKIGKCLEQEKQFLHCKEVINDKKCDKCEDEYYLSDDGNCVNTNYCLKSFNNLCIECKDGFYLAEKNNICSFEKNCSLADKDIGLCFSCIEEFYLDRKDGKCKSNKDYNEFLYCKEAEDVCISCQKNYFLGEDNLCSSSKNCSESKDGLCLSCEENYYLGLDHKCTIYENCIYSNYYYECIECQDGYYFDSFNKSCRKSTEEFENCKYSNQFSGYCYECKDGYYLTIKDKRCRSNEVDGMFYKCKVTDYNEFCYKCVNGYYLSTGDKRCSKVDGCKYIKNENECNECEHDNCLNMKNYTCHWNDVIEKEYEKIYYKCNYTNLEGTKCEACDENYTLTNEGLCLNNFDCENLVGNTCMKCKKENIYGNYLCLNKDFGCVETFTDACKRCDLYDFYQCTECYEGYQLDEYNNCEKINNDGNNI